ncbi:uncharacterized protein A4U43_C03F11880 [Asparagus officinalis]|uniref:Uncharacterized protein n=1 Tax=Asparagus officinalis TaxID=4686 RepID=A0A5P1FE99_ASPOF|nr:uncharacterized protein A4U43_C03F11880 [Asparagus officinalis]
MGLFSWFGRRVQKVMREGVHHCLRCAPHPSATDAAPVDAAAPAKEKAKKFQAPPPTVPTETNPAVLTVPSPSAKAAERSSGSVGVAREAMDEKYTDFSHLGWVIDLVDW